MTPRPARRTTPEEVRRLFNDGGYYEKLQRGELFAVLESSRPASAEAGQPAGTTSEIHVYFDLEMLRVAVVHQYVLPDGSLGGSGRPDPKRLLLDNEILFV